MTHDSSIVLKDRFRPLWDFSDLEATERRFRALLQPDATDAARAEVLTQVARVRGLQGRFADGDELVDDAEGLAGSNAAATARVHLERGRLRRSSGDPAAALPLFESAFAVATDGGEAYLAADAAHMAALAAPDSDGMLDWTNRGVEVAEAEPDAAYWLGPLLSNFGWAHYDEGEYEAALVAFDQALQARERDPERAAEIQHAKYGVAKTLRALGRPDEAAALVEQAVAWTERVREPDGYFHEELAEAYAALRRDQDAREHATLALSLLPNADPSFVDDPERVTRLRRLAGLD